jgi:hypothetical protein
MCGNKACACCSVPSQGGSGLLDAFLAGLWWLLVRAVNGVGLVLLGAAMVAYRWLSGAPMWGATSWALPGWPRWQRAVARTVVTAVGAASLLRPWSTAAIVAAVGAVTALAALETRRRTRVDAGPIRVESTIRSVGDEITSTSTGGQRVPLSLQKESAR